MKEINYKKLEDLIKSLEKGLKRLKKGKISTDEMNLLLEDSRNLHERIAVLQYLSFESPTSKEKAISHKIDAKKAKDINKEKVDIEEKNQITNQKYEKEVARLVIHGSLHLLGYADDTLKQKKEMSNLEEVILNETKWESTK